jgi:putative transposase
LRSENSKEVKSKGVFLMYDVHSLSHTKWNCKYHIVFAPKYRRKVFYEEKRLELGEILRELCKWKGVDIIEAEVCPDHIHMLLEIPPKISVSSFMGFLKGKSSLMIYEKWGNMKFKYRNREFWCRGYYVDTAGKDAKKIQEYIQKQLKEDQLGEQLTMEESSPLKK